MKRVRREIKSPNGGVPYRRIRASRDPQEPGPRPAWAKKLKTDEWLFVREYLIDLSGRDAVRRMTRIQDKTTAQQIAQRYLRCFAVCWAIDQALALEANITRPRIVQELAAIAFSKPKDYASWDENGVRLTSSDELMDDQAAAISEIKERNTPDGPNVELKFHDKLSALEKLAKVTNLVRDPDLINAQQPVTVNIIRFGDRVTNQTMVNPPAGMQTKPRALLDGDLDD